MRTKGELDGNGQRALCLPEFCRRYGVGRSKAYLEIKAGRLKARKCGDRTLVSTDDAEAWLRSLPVLGSAPTVGRRQNGKRRKIAPQRRGSVSC
jgi:hypothetical protein